ncbi:MAG: DUF58 domain-containing protein [Bacteroidetes bacterium]|nr:DUF58 domain-containing protein [Bacteroidota bacterium]MBU1720101.1 DUF58 domain-containing protein [Bacteroidota bacterium]
METTELLKKVRKIEIKTRGLSSQVFSGEYHSVFKGKGMAFSEVREYQYGDDIRSIDWNVTARFNNPFVKIFEEERELTVMLLVDISSSADFGTTGQTKRDLITELAAVLSFSAIQNNDKVGLILFSDKIEMFIPPKKGKKHILRIIRELLNFEPQNTGTSIRTGLEYFMSVIKKRSISFLLSDFIDRDYENALKIASRKHDMIGIRIYDKRETTIPSVGLFQVKDAETGRMQWIDTSSSAYRNALENWWKESEHYMNEVFSKRGVDFVKIQNGEDYVKPLMHLFKKRAKRR